jgi:class 3 adenylate cyclase
MPRSVRRLLLRLVGTSRLSCADAVVVTSLIVLPFTISYAVLEWNFLRDPGIAPYVDPEFVRMGLAVQTRVFIPGWAALLLLGLWARRRRPESPLLAHLAIQFYFAGFALPAYWLGPFTDMFGVIILMAGATLGLLLFDARVIRWGVASFLAVIAAATVAEQLDWIPYAPVFRDSPYAGGTLASSWLFVLGGMGALALLIVTAIVMLSLEAWREGEQRLARATALIRRYVPSQLAEGILSGAFVESDRPHRRKLTIFFSDVEGFTAAADQLEPEDLAALLDQYLSEMADIADAHGATISHLAGDGIMIFFGGQEPSEPRDGARRCVQMALEMQARMHDLRRKWFGDGIQTPFRIRIGINTGAASVGSFGSSGRRVYSAFGTQVNLAARIESSCEAGSILISHSTWALVHDAFDCRERGEIEVKGIHFPVRIYEVVGPPARL